MQLKRYFFKEIIFILFIIVILPSCSLNKKKPEYCINSDSFDITLTSNALSRINNKVIMDNIINYSNINIDQNSNYLIQLNIDIRRRTSIVSINNEVENQNINFIVKYNIFDKKNKTVLDGGKFIIIENFEISDDRFANFATDNYLMENFARNLSVRLESFIDSLLINKNCKKIQNEVAFYDFNVNINLGSMKGSYYV